MLWLVDRIKSTDRFISAQRKDFSSRKEIKNKLFLYTFYWIKEKENENRDTGTNKQKKHAQERKKKSRYAPNQDDRVYGMFFTFGINSDQ